MLTFDPGPHVYRWNGAIVPSVTQVLDAIHPFYKNLTQEQLEAARLRGTNVHLACQYDDERRLDPAWFDDEELGYLEGWRKFSRESEVAWEAIEEPIYRGAPYCYAGTPDRVGMLMASGDDDWIIDIKTSAAKHPLWGPQTAGYGFALNRGFRRASVRLTPDGRYFFDEWTDDGDLSTFLSALNIYRWARRHNL